MNDIFFSDLGIIEYGKAWEIQEALMQHNLSLKAAAYNEP